VVFNSYPFSDINGIDNKFCPVSGVELISNCSNCKKPILNAEQVFCMGCGEIIFFEYERHIDEIVKLKSFVDRKRSGVKSLNRLIDILNNQIKKLYRMGIKNIIKDLRPKTIREALDHRDVSGDPDEGIQNLEDFIFRSWTLDSMPWSGEKYNLSDYLDGIHSKNEIMAQWHKRESFRELFLKKIIEEIKKYIVKINDNQMTDAVDDTEFSDDLDDF